MNQLVPAPSGEGARATTTVARLLTAGSIGYLLLGLVLHWSTPAPDRAALLATPEPVIGPAAALVGAVLLGRVPGHRVLLLMVGIGCFACTFAGSTAVAAYGFAEDAAPGPVFQGPVWLTYWTWAPAFLGLALVLPLIFPNGRLPSRRWLPAAAAAWTAIGCFCLVGAFTDIGSESGMPPNPLAVVPVQRFQPIPDLVAAAILLVLLALALASLVVRFHGAGGMERRQIGWLRYAVVLTVVAAFVAPSWLNAGASLAVPIAVGVAVVRYRHFDIDLVINRTLVGTGLLACSAVLYVAVVGWLGGIVGGRGAVVGFLGAIAVAAAFHPLYVRIQRGVDRLLFGSRGTPYEVLAQVGSTVREARSPRDALSGAVDIVAHGLKLPAVSVRVDRPPYPPLFVSFGDPSTATHEFPLDWNGQPIGSLRVALRSGTRNLDDVDRVLLADIATQLAAVGFAARLTRDLEQSRERLVSAREEERRLMRRNLHDGLGPQLASAVMALDVAHRSIVNDVDRAAYLVSRAREQVQEAVADVRRLVDGLRPPALDDLGLVNALQLTGPAAVTGDGAPEVSVEDEGDLDRLPAAVEVAAFRIAQEAITNAVRHSGCTLVTVRLAAIPDSLTVEVTDDGSGLPANVLPGVGFTSMAERAAELGGSCDVSSRPTRGCRVTVTLPTGKAVPR